jgi:hypothetical protein
MANRNPRRTDEEWLNLIQEFRRLCSMPGNAVDCLHKSGTTLWQRVDIFPESPMGSPFLRVFRKDIHKRVSVKMPAGVHVGICHKPDIFL